ncbi:hypothetical protein [Dyadobacter diqingensis]|uniref:hypothetical protein n=1 Tax=Dyadobacter diqingensis TaxID=2938121 RepID=UPI0020C4E9EF|nr:hypothetical protein [Dyadobacter diqingensis]
MVEKKTPSKTALWKKVTIGLIALPIATGILSAIFNGQESPKDIKEKARLDSIQAVADSTKTMLSNIRYLAKKSVKDNLKDPDSFEEIEHAEYKVTNPTPLAYYQAKIKYRAKNSFGGYVVESKCFNFLKNGVVTENYDCE